MAVTLSEVEDLPDSYPSTGTATGTARDVPAAMIWQRIEAWTAVRWPVRAVVYIAEGPGEWRPRLSPVTITSIETWRDDAWQTVTPRSSCAWRVRARL